MKNIDLIKQAKKFQLRLCEPQDFCAKGFEGQFFITFGLYSVVWYSRVLDSSSILKWFKNIPPLKLLNFHLLSLCKQEINQLVSLPGDLEKPAFLHEFKPKSGMGMCSEYGLRLNENQPEVGPRLLKALQIISGLLGKCCPAVIITDALQQLLYK